MKEFKVFHIKLFFAGGFLILMTLVNHPLQIALTEVIRRAVKIAYAKNINAFLKIAVLGICITFVQIVVQYITTIIEVKFKEKVSSIAQSKVLSYILSGNTEYLSQFHNRDILQRTIYDSSSFIIGKFDVFKKVFNIVFSFFIIIGYALSISFELTFVVIFISVLPIFIAKIYGGVFQRLTGEVIEKDTLVKSYLHDSIQGFEMIITSSYRKKFTDKFTYKMQSYRNQILKRMKHQSMYQGVTSLIQNICFLIFVSVGFILINNKKLTSDGLLAFVVLYGNIIQPINSIGDVIKSLKIQKVYTERLSPIISSVEPFRYPIINNYDNYLKVGPVNFKYCSEDNNIFNNFVIQFEKEKPNMIIGKNGTGKSTLLNAIVGQLRISEPYTEKMEMTIGFSTRIPDLYSCSLKENILLGRCLDDLEFSRILDIVQLKEFIDTLPEGDDTILGKDGGNMSLGQRQKIGLARAIIHHPDLLILDEATSAIDVETDNLILDKLCAYCKDSYIIIVTHRLSEISGVINVINFKDVINK